MTSGFQARTTEWMWPVVATAEPEGVRVARGYVTILEHETGEESPCSFRVMFSDAEGRPLQSLPLEDLDIFYDAAYAAFQEMDLDLDFLPPHVVSTPPVGDIIR